MKTFTVHRPWGKFDQFTKNENTTIKLHFIKPHSSWSLQYHKYRSEFWRVVSGNPIITIGESKINAKPGDEFIVEKMEKHRMETQEEGAVILEICYGDFDEDDIVRIEDKYGRVK